jgi:hypothetical protein
VIPMEFGEVVVRRRSIRKFKEDPCRMNFLTRFLKLSVGLHLRSTLNSGVSSHDQA